MKDDTLEYEALVKEAKKLGISPLKQVKLDIENYASSAKKVAEDILKFLTENQLEDAYWEVDSYEKYGDTCTDIKVAGYVPMTKAELKKAIDGRKDTEDRYKKARREQYEQLKKEFEG